MSTNDVPGYNPANRDVLAAGAWAEHDDGSLIYIKGVEQGRVIYEIYDVAVDPPQSYTDAMEEGAFKRQFSWSATGASIDRWTWHDKTPFPWDRVIAVAARPRPGYASAADQMSAAQRVAESLNLRGRQVNEESVRAQTESRSTGRRGAEQVIDQIADALKGLFR